MRNQTLRNPGRDVPQVQVVWPDNIGTDLLRPPIRLRRGMISIEPGTSSGSR